MVVPALAALRQLAAASVPEGRRSRLDRFLDCYDRSRDRSGRYFAARVGKETLLAARHVKPYIWSDRWLFTQSGLSPAALGNALASGKNVVARPDTGCFAMSDDVLPLLRLRQRPNRDAVTCAAARVMA